MKFKIQDFNGIQNSKFKYDSKLNIITEFEIKIIYGIQN